VAEASEVLSARGWALPSDLAEEERLVRAAAGGEREAFLAIYDRHAGGLYGYALQRLRDPGRAEDLVQEVFLALVRTGGRYHARAPLRAFLYRVARNRVLNFLRDARPEDELQEMGARAPAYEAILDVRRALASLPERFREPILLATYPQLTYPEIARVLGCPVGTVRSRISRGKRLMAEMLREGAR
jgi:RNA polymerase sigma-70 factor (ECF subfamily)